MSDTAVFLPPSFQTETEPSPWPLSREMPSITYKGWLSPVTDVSPLITTLFDPVGVPDFTI